MLNEGAHVFDLCAAQVTDVVGGLRVDVTVMCLQTCLAVGLEVAFCAGILLSLKVGR